MKLRRRLRLQLKCCVIFSSCISCQTFHFCDYNLLETVWLRPVCLCLFSTWLCVFSSLLLFQNTRWEAAVNKVILLLPGWGLYRLRIHLDSHWIVLAFHRLSNLFLFYLVKKSESPHWHYECNTKGQRPRLMRAYGVIWDVTNGHNKFQNSVFFQPEDWWEKTVVRGDFTVKCFSHVK